VVMFYPESLLNIIPRIENWSKLNENNSGTRDCCDCSQLVSTSTSYRGGTGFKLRWDSGYSV
jgi:hypothetical protein